MSSQGHKLYCSFLGYHYWRIGLEKEREQHWAERRRHCGAKAVRMEGGALGAVQLQQVAGGKGGGWFSHRSRNRSKKNSWCCPGVSLQKLQLPEAHGSDLFLRRIGGANVLCVSIDTSPPVRLGIREWAALMWECLWQVAEGQGEGCGCWDIPGGQVI